MNTTIRNARSEDTEVLADMIKKSYRTVAEQFQLTRENCPKHPSNCTLEWIEKDLERGVRYFIIEADAIPVGCAAIENAEPNMCYLERLSVIPEYRKRGYGRLLVDRIKKEAEKINVIHIGIGIIAEQTDLRNWYENLGFVYGETKQFEHLPFAVGLMKYTS
jgi:N-acetylglutamate synthase-like GNAT family acetyltransferase